MPMYSRRQWLALSGGAVAAAALAGCGASLPGTAPADAALIGLHMIGPTRGWGYGGAGVYRTADGGAGWVDASPPARPTRAVIATAFADERTAWAALAAAGAVTVFATRDRGARWTAARPAGVQGLVPTLLTFADRRHGWLWASGGASSGTEPGTLLFSTDGGAHWGVAAATGASGGGALPAQGIKSGLAFHDARRGWISGADPQQPGTVWLFATSDGGRTWRRQDLPLAPSDAGAPLLAGAPVFFGSAGVLPLLSARGRQSTLRVYTTSDAGASWQATGAVSSPHGALVACFADAGHWLATDGVNMYASGNAGESWTAFLSQPQHALAGVTQLDFLTPAEGWALRPAALGPQGPVSMALLHTSDGGLSWKTLSD